MASQETFTEIANIVANMAIDTETDRAIPASTILQAMKDELHYSLKPNASAKQQALLVLKMLKNDENCEYLNIDRANMRLEISCDSKSLKVFVSENSEGEESSLIQKLENIDYNRGRATILAQPGHLKAIEEKISQMTRGKGDVDVLELNAVDTEEIEI